MCSDAVLLVATTIAPAGMTCEYVSGVPFLTDGKPTQRKKIVEIVSPRNSRHQSLIASDR